MDTRGSFPEGKAAGVKLTTHLHLVELHLTSSSTPSWRGVQLKHRDNFTFNFAFTLQVAWPSEDVVSYHITAWYRNPEDRDMKVGL
jgi:hypothetical protein